MFRGNLGHIPAGHFPNGGVITGIVKGELPETLASRAASREPTFCTCLGRASSHPHRFATYDRDGTVAAVAGEVMVSTLLSAGDGR